MANVQSAYSVAEMDNAIGKVPSKADISYVDSKVAAIKQGTKLYKHTITANVDNVPIIAITASATPAQYNSSMYAITFDSPIISLNYGGMNGALSSGPTNGIGQLGYFNGTAFTVIPYTDETSITDTVTEL